MRILMISPQFRPMIGGYESAAERLSIALKRRGHDVTVLAERRSREWLRTEVFDDVLIRRWWCVYRRRFHMLSSLSGLAWNLAVYGRSFQVWHVHQYGAHAALAIAMGFALRRPVVLKLTSSSKMGIAQTLSSGFASRLIISLHRRVTAVVALTQEMAVEAIAFGIPASRVHILGNAVDTERFTPPSPSTAASMRKTLGLGADRVVLFVGRMVEAKNLNGLISAWKLAIPAIDALWILVLVGDGPERHEAENLAEILGIKDRIRFVGQQTNIQDWMMASDIYVISSRREGLSNTMLEAMATGLPIVTTAVSGASENISQTASGIVVDVGDSSAISEAIIKFANDPQSRSASGTNARSSVQSRYSLEAVAKQHERLYQVIMVDA